MARKKKNPDAPETGAEKLSPEAAQAAENGGLEAAQAAAAEDTAEQEAPQGEKPAKEKRPFNRRKLRFGAYATGFTALFIAGLVVVNVIASYLSKNYPLNLDFTADKIFTVSEDNKKYIKDVKQKIEVTICSDEANYTSGAVASYLGMEDQTGGKYFVQAVELLREYEKLNKNITFKFADPQDPSFAAITQKYTDLSFAYGDFLVTRTGSGSDRHKLLKTQDLFTTEDSSGYGAGPFTITGSNVEGAVTNAIYAVASDKTFKVAVLTGHGEADVSALKTVMQEGNYEFAEVKSLVTAELPADADIVLIAGPATDYSGTELDKLTAFLAANKESDKGLFYFADSSKPKLPNLWEFLAEWGIKLHEGVVYETDANYHIQNEPTVIFASSASSDYTKALDEASTDYFYVGQNHQAITRGFETQDSRETAAVVSFQDSAVMRPYNYGESWKAETAATDDVFDLAVISKDTQYEETEPNTSYVAAFSSVDLISSTWAQYTDVGNTKMVLSASNAVVGADSTNISIASKTIGSNTFTANATVTRIITIIFAAALPLAVLAAGLAIWFRRKNL